MESAGLVTQLGTKVAAAVLLALAACGVARRFHLTRTGPGCVSGPLRLLETASLGQNRALHIVAVGQRAFLLASTPGQVVLLGDVTTDLPTDDSPVEPVARLTFASVLARLLPTPAAQSTAGGQADWLQAASSALRASGARSAPA